MQRLIKQLVEPYALKSETWNGPYARFISSFDFKWMRDVLRKLVGLRWVLECNSHAVTHLGLWKSRDQGMGVSREYRLLTSSSKDIHSESFISPPGKTTLT